MSSNIYVDYVHAKRNAGKAVMLLCAHRITFYETIMWFVFVMNIVFKNYGLIKNKSHYWVIFFTWSCINFYQTMQIYAWIILSCLHKLEFYRNVIFRDLKIDMIKCEAYNHFWIVIINSPCEPKHKRTFFFSDYNSIKIIYSYKIMS